MKNRPAAALPGNYTTDVLVVVIRPRVFIAKIRVRIRNVREPTCV